MIVAYWADIGVDVELLPHPYTTLLGIMQGDKHEQMLETGKYNGTPLSILRIMGVNPGTWNPAMYGALEEDLDRAEGIFDPVERNKLLKELQIRMIVDAPYIWLPGVHAYGYTWPWVKNYYGEFSLGAAVSHPIYATMWLDLDLKEEMTGKR